MKAARRLTVLDESGEERLGGEVLVVLVKELAGRGSELEGDKLVAALLEARDDLADEATLDAVGPGRVQERRW
jgi:hypothetical protein